MRKPTAGRNVNSASPTRSMPEPGREVSLWHRTGLVLAVVALAVAASGCGESKPAVDSAPFEAAVSDYLARNDMALRLKKIRQGPTVDGDRATMSASMTSRDVGGMSVVWEIEFQRRADGQWTVVGHQD